MAWNDLSLGVCIYGTSTLGDACLAHERNGKVLQAIDSSAESW